MTISYSSEVANGSSFGCFWRILCKWKGSVYKLVWRELLVYLCLYYVINFVYRYALDEVQQKIFRRIGDYFNKRINDAIPLSFVLGFYVTLVVKRWWEQYRLLPWPDTLALYISAGIPGNDERGRLMRRNIVRYAVLAYVITLQRVSLRVKKRFPTLQHIVDSGLMMDSERKIFEMMNNKSPMSKYWMPLVWATNIINRARKESLITSDHIVQTLLIELSDIRRRLGGLIGYDTVCVPLVYTQVATIAVYIYFLSTLIGNQFFPIDQGDPQDLYFPFFTVLQFGFYVGWLKVAEVLINPFGEDDDDIELNWLIDRHIKAAYMIVDEMHEEHPELLKDQYWEDVIPTDLPYTVASEQYRKQEPKGSAEMFKVKDCEAVYANIIPSRKINDDTYADYESVDTPIIERRRNWFVRQLSRMGSIRSSSTAYSSGGLFNRNRINSVYSNPEAGGIIPHSQQHTPRPSLGHIHQKMSLYDRFVNRKSGRNQKQRTIANIKTNSNGVINKSRPRIPTPEVIIDKDNTKPPLLPTSTPVTLVTTSHQNITTSDFPMVQVVLAPIQESDSNGSVHNTLHAHQPNTTALAESILTPTLTAIGIDPSTAAILANNPVTLSIATTANTKPSSPNMSLGQFRKNDTETQQNDRSDTSIMTNTDRKVSVMSQNAQQKRNEVYV